MSFMRLATGLIAGIFVAALVYFGLTTITGATATDNMIRTIVPVVVGCVVTVFSIRFLQA